MFYLKVFGIVLVALACWGGFVGFSTLNGWWHIPLTTSSDPKSFIDAAKRIVAERNVGNLALVLVEESVVYDEYFVGVSQAINRETVFPVASMSKWITALGVMTLVEHDDLDLDVPISRYLTRWKLPSGDFSSEGVTVRRLLSHTSGLSDGLGFGDYTAEEAIPTLEDSLTNPRSSSGLPVQISITRRPGEAWDYSGGGYLILELLVEEVTGETFESYMQAAILQPLGMSRSTFAYIGETDNKTISYDAVGNPAPLFRYAASGATGFSSSAADLTRLVQALLSDEAALSIPARATTLEKMREPNAKIFGIDAWGLGTILYAPTASGDYIYGHDGQNEPAINATVRINPTTHDAIIVLVSGSPSLATYLGFEWVFWQTGVPDVLGIGYVTDQGMKIFSYGSVIILMMIFFGAWRMRRRSASSRISHV